MSSGGIGEATTRAPGHAPLTTAPSANTLLAVSYNPSTLAANLTQVAGREQAAGAYFVHGYEFEHENVAMRVVSVPTAKVAQTEALLRAQAGVQSIGVTGERRYPLTTNNVTTNDPYFIGFGANVGTKYAESPAIPGQWDMWAIGLPHAYGYSQAAGNSLGTANPNALGSSSIKIAVIDTGADSNHPELNSKLPYQRCHVTSPGGTPSTSNFSTDLLGHGTNVSGIAAAATGNGLGFTGAGGKAVIYGYRIFPTPNDSCANPSSTDPQCGSDTRDIIWAINDAVAQHVDIISMSLGGGSCTNGQDSDTGEGTAVANAIAAGVIVIAASGNGAPGTQGVTAPACDTGVIAVGATSLNDGTPTGTTAYSSSNVGSASAANPVEYVASYSQYGSPSAALRSASAWGIVAPGGDPANAETTSNGTPNDLHWIEHIWTSTPFLSSPTDTSFTGQCSDDYPNSSGTTPPVDCRTLIAGTSMSTPHVAGAAALILAVAPQYRSAVAMKQLLCSTADNLNDSHQGCGRLNVYTAMAKALGDPSPPTPIP